MSSSRSKGVVFDTNVLSIFVRHDRMNLLFQTFAYSHKTNQLYISPAIKQELETGVQKGNQFLERVFEFIDEGKIQVLELDQADQRFMDQLPSKLHAGEAEAIALCHRLGFLFVSHDRKALNYCQAQGIPSVRLTRLLDRLRRSNLLAEPDIEEMLE